MTDVFRSWFCAYQRVVDGARELHRGVAADCSRVCLPQQPHGDTHFSGLLLRQQWQCGRGCQGNRYSQGVLQVGPSTLKSF